MTRLHFLTLSSLILIPLACNKNKPVDTSGVDLIAKNILNAIAAGDARSVYDTYFTAEYKSEKSLKDWKDVVAGYQKTFGNVKTVKRLRGGARWIQGQFIDGQVVYDVTWEKGVGKMTLDVTKEDGWKVADLRIHSPQLDELKKKLTTSPAK